MKCEHCGKENIDGSKFCGYCGTKLEEKIEQTERTETASVEVSSEEQQVKNVQVDQILIDDVKIENMSGQKIGDYITTQEEVEKKPKKKWVYIVLAIMVLVALCFGSLSALYIVKKEKIEKKYTTYLEKAEKYLVAMDYQKAEEAYLKAIEIEPKKPMAYVELADLYVTQEKYEDAKEILEQAKENVEQFEENWSDDEKEAFDRIDGMIEEIEKIEEQAKITWVVEPTIEADDIFYMQDRIFMEGILNDINKQWMDYAVIKRNNKYDIIGTDGVLLSDESYDVIYNYDRHLVAMKNEREFIWNGQKFIEESWGYGIGLANCFYYKNELHLAVSGADDNYVQPQKVDYTIPVYQIDQIEFEEDYIATDVSARPPYAIHSNGKLVTEFIYEECGSIQDGLLAVKKDGKWGYVNADGKEIIPIEYDASWEYFYEDLLNVQQYREYCYASSEGYIPLVKNGVWEMRNSKGELMIPAGMFEAIRPVYQGKCWVKKDGKWGVIALNKLKKELEQKVEKDDSWKKLYLDYIEEFKTYDEMLEDYRDEYALIHIDDDGIPELYCDSLIVASGAELCTVHDGKLVTQHFLANGIDYVEKQGKFVDPYGRMDHWLFTFYSLKDGKFQKIMEKEADLYNVIDPDEIEKRTGELYREELKFFMRKPDEAQTMKYEEIVEAIKNY